MSDIKIYHLRIVPSNSIFLEVNNFKNLFIETFGKQKFSNSKPHITLAEFGMHPSYEEYIVKNFNKLSHLGKFRLDIDGFGVFGSKTDTLFLKVLKSIEIKYLHEAIKIIWKRDLHQKKKAPISATPHMTISKLEDEHMRLKSLNLFKNIDYKRQFEVNHLTLLSKYWGETWDLVHQISLK